MAVRTVLVTVVVAVSALVAGLLVAGVVRGPDGGAPTAGPPAAPGATDTPTAGTEPSTPEPTAPEGYRLVFHDGFDGDSLDPDRWSVCYPWGACTNAANDERQWYQAGNVTVSDGSLRLTARREDVTREGTDYAYTSGLVTTHDRFALRYGRVELRARVPAGQALWPAAWLLSTDLSYPPEIDIMEIDGAEPGTTSATVHSAGDRSRSVSARSADWSAEHHVWSMDWTPDRLDFAVDGVPTGAVTGGIPADDMYLLLNLAVGGSYVGEPGPATPAEAEYAVDWIRAYQRL